MLNNDFFNDEEDQFEHKNIDELKALLKILNRTISYHRLKTPISKMDKEIKELFFDTLKLRNILIDKIRSRES